MNDIYVGVYVEIQLLLKNSTVTALDDVNVVRKDGGVLYLYPTNQSGCWDGMNETDNKTAVSLSDFDMDAEIHEFVDTHSGILKHLVPVSKSIKVTYGILNLHA